MQAVLFQVRPAGATAPAWLALVHEILQSLAGSIERGRSAPGGEQAGAVGGVGGEVQ